MVLLGLIGGLETVRGGRAGIVAARVCLVQVVGKLGNGSLTQMSGQRLQRMPDPAMQAAPPVMVQGLVDDLAGEVVVKPIVARRILLAQEPVPQQIVQRPQQCLFTALPDA